MILKKTFFKLMNNAVFVNTIENVRKQRGFKLLTTKTRKNYLVSQPNYDTAKLFSENLLSTEMTTAQKLMNKLVYFGLSILELSKIKHNFRYDFVKPKYGEKVKLSYIDTDTFIVYIRKDYHFKVIIEDVQAWFDTSNYELNRPSPKGENKNNTLMKMN